MSSNLVIEILHAHERGEILVNDRTCLTVHKAVNKRGFVLATPIGLLCVIRPGTAVRLLDNKQFDLKEVDYPSHETAFLYATSSGY